METSTSKNTPDLRLIMDSANKCCHGNSGGVSTDHYLCIMRELAKLMELFHSGLSNHIIGIKKATKYLEIRRVSGPRCYYSDLQLMAQYETENDLLRGSSNMMSGSVALYDLNLALKFMVKFLDALRQKSLANASFQAAERIKVYMDTIGPKMSSLSQTSAKLALTNCPGRKGLMKKLSSCCHGDVDPGAQLGHLVAATSSIQSTVDQTLVDNCYGV